VEELVGQRLAELECAAHELVERREARDRAAAERTRRQRGCHGRSVLAGRTGNALLRESGEEDRVAGGAEPKS